MSRRTIVNLKRCWPGSVARVLLVRLMGIVRDVTDRRLAELRERLLADASELLGRTGDVGVGARPS